TKGNRITIGLGGWDAVLPTPTRVALQNVCRSRFQIERQRFGTLSFLVRITSQTHASETGQRQSDDDFKMREIAVPSELCPCLVLRNDRINEFLGGHSDPLAEAIAQVIKELGNGTSWKQFVVGEIVTGAIGHNAPLCRELLVLRFMQRQVADFLEKR